MSVDEVFCQEDNDGSAAAHSDAMWGFLRQDEESKLEDLTRCVHWCQNSPSTKKVKYRRLLQAAEEYVEVVKLGKSTK